MRTKLLTPTRLLIAFVLLCALAVSFVVLRGPRPALTVLFYGKPAANVVVQELPYLSERTLDDEGTLSYGIWESRPSQVLIPNPNGGVHAIQIPTRGHKTVDLRGRYTSSKTRTSILGLFYQTTSSEQFGFEDGDFDRLKRGEVTHEELRAKALKEAGVTD